MRLYVAGESKSEAVVYPLVSRQQVIKQLLGIALLIFFFRSLHPLAVFAIDKTANV